MELPVSFFPGFHYEGPVIHDGGGVLEVAGWGQLGRVQEDIRVSEEARPRRFIPLCDRKAELWSPAEPTLMPLLPPNNDGGFFPAEESQLVYKKFTHRHDTNLHRARTTLHFSRQMGQLCWDQGDIAFHCMGRLLEPHCYLGDKWCKKKPGCEHKLHITPLQSLQSALGAECPFMYRGYRVRALSQLTGDWLQDVPPAMLGRLLHEGMADDWTQLQFRESRTGGALCWAPFPGRDAGCLIYPRGAAMNQLHFQKVCADWSGVRLRRKPAVFELQHRILQISAGDSEHTCVGVRSMYNAAAWRFSAEDPPSPLGVLRTRTPCTCVAVSPHVPGQLCVCTEGGHLYLWSLERGLQSVRRESESLYFRDDSLWRWSDFSSHPRVLLYADRTGVQAADTRVAGAAGLDLFRVGRESSCQQGERLILARSLRESEPAHYLVTTQFSVYVMDERFPLVPLAKWTHMLERPPTFACALAGRTHKLLLATQHSQETLLLQYSGGTSGPYQMHLPPLRLPRNSESLHRLDPMPPHHRHLVAQRLASPLAGVAAAYTEDTPESLIVFQLTEAGDVFRQRLVYTAPGSTPEDPSSKLKPDPTVESSKRTSRAPPTLPASPNISSPSTEDSGSHGTAPQPITAQQNSRKAACGSARSRREAKSETSPGDAEGPLENELVSANQTGSKSGTHGGTAGDASGRSSLLTKDSKASFHRWIRTLLKDCKRTLKVPERSGRGIAKLFSVAELCDTAPEGPTLRESLRQSMRSRTLIKLEPLPVPETPGIIDSEGGMNVVSQRLRVAWDNQLAPWWDNYLGLNKDSKIQALREKRARLKRTHSQSSLSESFSSFGVASNFYETEATSPFSSDMALLTDPDVLSTSVVDEVLRSESPAPQDSFWSFQSGPSVRPNNPPPCLQGNSESTDPNYLSIVSSRSLRSKGIPRERRKTLQDFMTSFGQQIDSPAQPNPTSSVPHLKLAAPSQISSPLSQRKMLSQTFQNCSQNALTQPQASSQSFQPQASSQSFQPQASSQSFQPQTSSQLVRPETSSRRLRPRTSSQSFQPRTSSQSFQPQASSQSFQPQTSSQLVQPEPSSRRLRPRTSSQSFQPQTSSQSFQPQTSSQSFQPQTSSQSFQPQTSSQSFQPQTSSQSFQPQTSSQSFQPQASSQSFQPQASSQLVRPRTSSQSFQPQTSSQSFQPQTSSQSFQPQTSSQRVRPQTSSRSFQPQTSRRLRPETSSQRVRPESLSKSSQSQSGCQDVELLTLSHCSQEPPCSQPTVKRSRMGF